MKSVRLGGNAEPVAVGKIICVGANYSRHIKEMGRKEGGEPLLFLKPPSALVWNGGQIPYPGFTKMLHHELEMVLLIGKRGSAVSIEQARGYLSGVGVGLDLTARDRQLEDMKKGHPWAISKGFDSSAPVSDFVPLCEELDPDNLEMRLLINGEVRQICNTAEMIFNTDELVAYVSRYFTLEPGDQIHIEIKGIASAEFFIIGTL